MQTEPKQGRGGLGCFGLIGKLIRELLTLSVLLLLLLMVNIIEITINPTEEWRILQLERVESFTPVDTVEMKIIKKIK